MERDEKILYEMYRLAFSHSTPRGNFDELLANATTNRLGQKEIPFMDYECEADILEDIIERTMVKYDVPEYRRRAFSTSFYLGCSPKTKMSKTKKNIVKKSVIKHDIIKNKDE
jgi:hypothetical protein